ncbi:hypothetical protein L226DRAFT_304510 [Lentinus tigrinus ALCF2SS1-7]|uniref:Uncharacterized protein n=1 Tax=Lentinus tigrinus ALCF2SS1-6 TaxID=1328759 RepID=A0A5C2RST2_9APHY|nr:hypothetical protein L227DRAFT_355422 [Lentinus tigrinus ALCF2SS1-6]RPD69181.1 hypothetical protein L226DRAFT_304510 [Lentinus tigrinus ALCF2SS1-7]
MRHDPCLATPGCLYLAPSTSRRCALAFPSCRPGNKMPGHNLSTRTKHGLKESKSFSSQRPLLGSARGHNYWRSAQRDARLPSEGFPIDG